MVDCTYFTDFNKELTLYEDRLVLDYRKCDYNIEMYPFLTQSLPLRRMSQK